MGSNKIKEKKRKKKHQKTKQNKTELTGFISEEFH